MILRIGDAAAAEVLAAARWYEAEREGLGDEFIEAVTLAGSHIAANPLAWAIWPSLSITSRPVRRYVMERFPYALGYQVFEKHVEIVAVAHAHRRPGYWRGRTGR